MKKFLVSVAMVCSFVTPLPSLADDASAPLAAPIEQCIRSNAPQVETAIPDLVQAVNFLVSNLCADPIAAEQSRQNKLQADRQAEKWKKVCDEQKAQSQSGTATDKRVVTMNSFCSSMRIGFLTEPSADDGSYTLYSPVGAPPSAVALASRLLLDLRLSHLKSGQPH
jgi:hypothetical protein